MVEFGEILKVKPGDKTEILEVLLGNLGYRYIIEVDFVLFDQKKEQVQGAFKVIYGEVMDGCGGVCGIHLGEVYLFYAGVVNSLNTFVLIHGAGAGNPPPQPIP
jgi:hypothetical protein